MDFKLFLDELKDKLEAAGRPMLEDDLLKLCKVFFDHLGSFKYENQVAAALMPAASAVLKPLVDEQIEKIDPTDNV